MHVTSDGLSSGDEELSSSHDSLPSGRFIGLSLWARRIRLGRTVLGGMVTVAVILVAVYFMTQSSEESGQSTPVQLASASEAGVAPRPGMKAPDFAVPSLNGNIFQLSDYRGQPVWINFWATWCPPCRAEMKDIQTLQDQLKEAGVVFVAMNFGEDPQDVTRYVTAGDFTFNVGLDLDQSVAERYRMLALPTHIFIDSDGTIYKIRVGSLARKEMVDILDKLGRAQGAASSGN